MPPQGSVAVPAGGVHGADPGFFKGS